MPLRLNNHVLEYTTQEKHFRVERRYDGTASSLCSTRMQISYQMAYAQMGAGLYSLNGLSLKVSINMLNVYTIPAIMFGLETLILIKNRLQRAGIFPPKDAMVNATSTKSCYTSALYLMTGNTPLEAIQHKNTLILFINIFRCQCSTERELLERQLAMKDTNSYSWTTFIRKPIS